MSGSRLRFIGKALTWFHTALEAARPLENGTRCDPLQTLANQRGAERTARRRRETGAHRRCCMCCVPFGSDFRTGHRFCVQFGFLFVS